MREATRKSVEILMTLGFNELESIAYTFLVEHSPVTAYRIAQGIGKPVANTYKAVESLKENGAVLVDETGNKLYRAVPPAELLRNMESRFRKQQLKAEKALSRLKPVESNNGIYSLTTVDAVFNTCLKMLNQAEQVVIIDAFPKPLEQIKDRLESTSERGVRVTAQTYAPIEIPGVECVISNEPNLTFERWEGQWLCLIVDGAEYLFAYLDAGGTEVHQAVWSSSTFLSWIQYGNMVLAMLASELERLIKLGASQEELLKAIQKKDRWLEFNARGYRQLRAAFKFNGSAE